MFKRFTVAEDISAQTAVKSSVIREFKRSITAQYPAIEEYIDDIIPKKAVVLEAKGKEKINFIVVDGEQLFFRYRDGPFFPTLKLLHKYPIMVPRIQVDTGAIKFILGGANIMCPGITSAGGAMPVDLPTGAPVAIYAEKKEHALALGTMTMSTTDIREKNKGIAIEVHHHLDDMLWHCKSFE